MSYSVDVDLFVLESFQNSSCNKNTTLKQCTIVSRKLLMLITYLEFQSLKDKIGTCNRLSDHCEYQAHYAHVVIGTVCNYWLHCDVASLIVLSSV